LSPLPYLSAMLSSAYLSRNLTSPIATKDGGTLRTIGEACEYMAAIGRERELRPHWQGRLGSAQACCAVQDSLEYGLQVVRRTGNSAQHFRDCRPLVD
jgi:hypothetical protein